jgi:hypothetical protein
MLDKPWTIQKAEIPHVPEVRIADKAKANISSDNSDT